MNTHSHNILEFNKLKDVLNEYMVIEKNKERVYELGIYKDINSLRKDFEIVRDFIDFSKYDGGIETAGMRDILEILKKCDLMGMYFEPEELYDINQNLRLMRLFKNRLEDLDKYKEYPIRKNTSINNIGGTNPNAVLTNEDVTTIRERFVEETLPEIYKDYKEKVSFSSFKKAIYGIQFKSLPIYKKREKAWYLNGTCIDYSRLEK